MIDRLKDYDKSHQVSKSKGHLCVVLVVTRKSRELEFPLSGDALLTQAGGQVLGLGKGAVQAILSEHGVDRVLAEEGGRTSRGSIDNMRNYVGFLNELQAQGSLDLEAAEAYWIARIKAYFAGKPFTLRLDPAKSLRSIVNDLLEQAFQRQQETTGTMYAGAMMQHLVGAKLEFILPTETIKHHGSSVADSPSNRPGDFIVRKISLHVTTAPGEALIRKCSFNIEQGLKPIIITIADRISVAESLAKDFGIGGRVDVFEIEQFLATNIYEHSGFSIQKNRPTVEQLIKKYNNIVDKCESDPSLKIAVR